MKIKFITILGLLFLIGCSKSSKELFELSKEKLKNNQPELALKDLEKLLDILFWSRLTLGSDDSKANPIEGFNRLTIKNKAKKNFNNSY